MPSHLLRYGIIGAVLAAAVVILTTLVGGTLAQDAPGTPESDPETTGKLVVVPGLVEVGQTTLAVGFQVVPLDLEVKIEYSERFAPEGESCSAESSAGATPAAIAPTWVTLKACSVGEGQVRLVEADSGSVIQEVRVTVSEAGPTGQAAPMVTLNSVPSSLTVGDSDGFNVKVTGLDRDEEYELTTVPLTHGLAFNRGCTDFEKTQEIIGSTIRFFFYTIYGCAPSGANLWSYLSVDGSAIASSEFTFVRVRPPPTPTSTSTSVPPTPTPTSVPPTPTSVPPTPTSVPPTPTPTPTPQPTPTSVPPTPTPTPTPSRPSPPRPTGVSTSATGETTISVSWNSITGVSRYRLRYRESGTSQWTTFSSNIGGTRRTVGGLERGTPYFFRVSAYGDGTTYAPRWGPESSSVSATTLERPGQVSTPTLTEGNGSLTVDWEAPSGAAVTGYKVQHKRTSASWPGTERSVSSSTTQTNITGLINGTAYHVRVQACNAAGCGDWSSLATGTPNPPPLAAPTNLVVTPLPLRKARLTWTGAPNADGYVVEGRDPKLPLTITEPPEQWNMWTPLGRNLTCAVPFGQTAEVCGVEIELDDIIHSRGLAHADAYEFRVRATDSSDTYGDSADSETITIIDTPILSVNGDSREAPMGEGQVDLEWTPIEDILGDSYAEGNYSFQYRKLGLHTDAESGDEVAHSDYRWRPTNFGPGQTSTDDVITGLELEEIYAIQLRYIKYRPGTQTVLHRVYAARDMYVWPAKSFAIRLRVATFPLNYSMRDKRYVYRVCEETFPGSITLTNGEKANPGWRNAIEHALEQWESATAGLVEITLDTYTEREVKEDPELNDDIEGRSKPCVSYSDDDSEFVDDLANKIAADYPGVSKLTDKQREALTNYLDTLHDLTRIQADDKNLNEIKMVHASQEYGTDGVNLFAIGAFPEFAEYVGFVKCIFSNAYGCVSEYDPIGSFGLFNRSADIFLNQENLGTTRPPAIPVNVRFNKCLTTTDHLAYSVLVHEAGHALGIRDADDAGRFYHRHHPFFSNARNTVMSWTSWDTAASICSPHPFDILAIYALYQSR